MQISALLEKDFKAGSFNAVISNPPFYPELSGRLNPDDQKAISRHELFGTLTDFINISHYLLNLSGKFLTIYPSSRIVDLIGAMRASALSQKLCNSSIPEVMSRQTWY